MVFVIKLLLDIVFFFSDLLAGVNGWLCTGIEYDLRRSPTAERWDAMEYLKNKNKTKKTKTKNKKKPVASTQSLRCKLKSGWHKVDCFLMHCFHYTFSKSVFVGVQSFVGDRLFGAKEDDLTQVYVSHVQEKNVTADLSRDPLEEHVSFHTVMHSHTSSDKFYSWDVALFDERLTQGIHYWLVAF